MSIRKERDTLDLRYRAVEEHLRNNRSEAALAELRNIDALEKVLAHKTRRARILAVVTFVLVTTIVITFGLAVKLRSTEVDLFIKTNGMELISATKNAPVLAGATVKSIGISIDNVEYFNSIQSDIYEHFNRRGRQPAKGDISVEAKSVVLDKLSLEPMGRNPTIMIDYLLGNISIYVRNSKLSGSLLIKDPARPPASLESTRPQLFSGGLPNNRHYRYFNTGEYGSGAVPQSIRFFNVRALDAAVIDLQSVRFVREHPPGSGNPQSTITGGTLRLLDINKEIQFRRGDFLSLECKGCARNAINYENENVTLTLRGSITRLAGGHEKDFKNYMPTLLEYVYHNEKIAMVWAATLLILGLLWKLLEYI